MLVPAIRYKAQLEEKFSEVIYSEEYFYYVGNAHCHELPQINSCDYRYNWAIINGNKEVVGFLAYTIEVDTDTVYNFGMFGFDGNPIMGYDVVKHLEELISHHHRIEWRCIDGNPVLKHYMKFVEKHNGNYVVLHDVTKDLNGQYHNEYIFEIVNK